jgi:hypothetical protein
MRLWVAADIDMHQSGRMTKYKKKKAEKERIGEGLRHA